MIANCKCLVKAKARMDQRFDGKVEANEEQAFVCSANKCG